jgi:hypothetical protein
MNQKQTNWHVWIGLLLCIVGFLSYFLVFVRYPATRDIPWVNFLLLAAGLGFLISGLRRAFGQPEVYRGKILGSLFAALGLAIAGFFCFVVLVASRQLPKSANAPRLGQKAPEFTLLDTNHQEVSLASLLAAPLPNSGAPPKGVFLVFYRGYW